MKTIKNNLRNMTTINEILADAPNEEDPFAGMEKETPAESPTANEPKEGEPKEGDNTPQDNIPFHKHPRWIERENELKSLREQQAENARVIAELKVAQEEIKPADTSIPEWFRELYGDNQIGWQKYNEHEQAKEQAIEQRLLERQEQARQQKETEVKKWNSWVDSEIEKLQSQGAKFDRNELVKIMIEYAPTTDNNYDFQKGYKIYEALKSKPDPAHSQARKELADTTTKTSGEPTKKDYLTSADLRHRSWGSL